MSISALPEPIKKIVRPLYYFLFRVKIALYAKLYRSKISDGFSVPIIINNFNRVTYLRQLVESLESRGYHNIYIIDNASTYPPLLKFYDSCKYKVFRLKENFGFRAFWESGIYKNFLKDYYVYTDSDVVPCNECPNDFLDTFLKQMKKDNTIFKIGMGLKIDDLPECFANKGDVLEWEAQYHKNIYDAQFFEANVDTTFALYRPGLKQSANLYVKMLRSRAPIEAYHLPWYSDSKNLSEEDVYYIMHAKKSTHWTAINTK